MDPSEGRGRNHLSHVRFNLQSNGSLYGRVHNYVRFQLHSLAMCAVGIIWRFWAGFSQWSSLRLLRVAARSDCQSLSESCRATTRIHAESPCTNSIACLESRGVEAVVLVGQLPVEGEAAVVVTASAGAGEHTIAERISRGGYTYVVITASG